MPWAAQGPQERRQPLTQASSVVGALPLPSAMDPFEVTGLILVPATHAPLEVAGQRWPERGDSSEGVGIRHPPFPTPQVHPMQVSWDWIHAQPWP